MNARSGQLWFYVESKAESGEDISHLVNCAHIAFMSSAGKGSVITMSNGRELAVPDHIADLTERLQNPLDDGRIEVAFLTDAED